VPSSPVVSAGALLLAYLIGSIPFSLILGRVVGGIDLREHGSKNVGATNVTRLLGWRWGAMALLLDALKGLLPTLVIPKLVDGASGHLAVGCGVAAILGHMFSCFLKFKGGKGVATSLGVVSVLAPWGALAALGTFIVLFAWKRIVSLGSFVASAVFAAVQMWVLSPQPFAGTQWSLALFSLAVPALVIFRHRANIGRLLRGEEKALHPVGPATAASLSPEPMIRPAGEGNSGSFSQSGRNEASSRPL
jgi:glycerol-3-phosphate acyltransferase PlsY